MEISDVEWKERLDKIRKILEKNAQNSEAVYYGFLDFDGVINVSPLTPVNALRFLSSTLFEQVPNIERLAISAVDGHLSHPFRHLWQSIIVK